MSTAPLRFIPLLALLLGCQSKKEPTENAAPSGTPSASASASAATGPTPSGTPKKSKSGTEPKVAASSEAEFIPDIPLEAPPPTARPDTPEGPERNRAIISGYGFPGYPALVHLCGKRVYQASGGHLTWDAFVSADPPKKVLEHYKSRLTERGFADDKDGGTWRLPPQSAVPDRVLTIKKASAPGPHRGCDEVPSKDAKSVLIMSRQR